MATEKKLTDANVSEIDKALNDAKQRKVAKAARTGVPAGDAPAEPKQAKAPKVPSEPKRPRLSDEEKAQRATAKENVRNEKKAAREVARTAKKAERDANKPQAHLKKVQRAAENLGELNQAALLLFNEATANLTAADLAALASHISHFNRTQATLRALDTKLVTGMKVTIIGGDPRFIGKVGTVSKSQRIRAYIDVEGAKKPIYVFTSDCQPVAAEVQTKSA